MPAKTILSIAESAALSAPGGRTCTSCLTHYQQDEVADHFAVDGRMRDALSRLCVDCLRLQHTATARRAAETSRDYEARKRAAIQATRFARARERLEQALPEHGVPPCALPDYPSPSLPSPRPPGQSASLTRLYGHLLDSGLTTWEQVGKQPRHLIRQNIGLGDTSFAMIDEHLVIFGLDPLKP